MPSAPEPAGGCPQCGSMDVMDATGIGSDQIHRICCECGADLPPLPIFVEVNDVDVSPHVRSIDIGPGDVT